MGGKARRLWPLAAIVVVIAVVGAFVWTVWRSPHRGDLSTFGAFVVAVIAPVVSLVVYLARLRRPGRPDRPLSELADSLAAAVMEQWTRAALERRLVHPEPIPVHWGRSSRPLAGPVSAAVGSRQFPPLPGLPAVAAGQLRDGRLQDLHTVYGGLGSGRLVIIGAPGSGKSGAAVLLILAALKYRAQMPAEDRQLVPVPVLVTVHGWDPSNERVGHWLAARLQQTYPLFAGRGGLDEAAALVKTARIAVILDGLDEVPDELRPPALRALSDQADFRVVVLGRSDEMTVAASQEFLQGAVVLELRDVSPRVAADYLTRVQRDPPPAGWGELTSRLRRAPGSPIARALSLPLTLTLVRDTYRGGDDVGQLLDFCDAGGHGASRESIEDYLLDRVLPAAYAPRPGEPPPRYGLPTARRALGQIAARMNRDGSRDLAWWRIPGWAPVAPRAIVSGLLFGLLFAAGRPVFGLIVAAVFACLYPLGKAKPPVRRAPLRWRHLLSRSSLTIGLQSAVGGVIFGGLIAFGLGVRPGDLPGLVVGIGVGVGLAGAVTAGLSQPGADDASPLTPRTCWRRDQLFGLVGALIFGLGIGFGLGLGLGLNLALGREGWPLLGFVLVFVGVLVYTLAYGVLYPQTWSASLAFAQLAIRWHTPARLLRFLEDAYQRGVLRTVGPVYQFRHARLQDRLAGQATRE